MANGNCVFKYRVGSDGKESVPLSEAVESVENGLDLFQRLLLDSAKERLVAGTTIGATYEEMKTVLAADESTIYPGPGLFLVPWKCDAENEEKIKEECKATIRCYPLHVNSKGMAEGKKCFYSGEDATTMALFGRAF